MSGLRSAVKAAVAVLLAADAAAALCARRSLTASLLEWLYDKAAGGGQGGAPFIMIGNTPFAPSEIAVLASPCILGVLLAALFAREITQALAMASRLFRHRHEASDSLPTLMVSSDELFKGGLEGGGQGRGTQGAGDGAPGGAGDPEDRRGPEDPGDPEDPDDQEDPEDDEYPGGWFDEEGWHDDAFQDGQDEGDPAPGAGPGGSMDAQQDSKASSGTPGGCDAASCRVRDGNDKD